MEQIKEAAGQELDALRKLAMAATPGPWRGDRYDGTVKYDLLGANDEPVISGDNGNSDHGPYGIRNEADEKFLMAANPAAILALLDTIASQRQVIAGQDRYREAIAHACEGFNMSPDLRKFLETVLFAPVAPHQESAA